MTSPPTPDLFHDAAQAAFPPPCRALAEKAAGDLAPFVDTEYLARLRTADQFSIQMDVSGTLVCVPNRIHFMNVEKAGTRYREAVAQCLLTRSTDGRARQKALNAILGVHEHWIAPFVALLLGEYVVEIIQDIQESLPSLDRNIYASFVRRNPATMQRLRSRATSYWNAYYGNWERDAYPGLNVLDQLEQWAS